MDLFKNIWKVAFFLPRQAIGFVYGAIPGLGDYAKAVLDVETEASNSPDAPLVLRPGYRDEQDGFDTKDFLAGVVLILTLFGLVAGYFAAKNLLKGAR